MKIILTLSLVVVVGMFHRHEHPVVKTDLSGYHTVRVCSTVRSDETAPATSHGAAVSGTSDKGGKNFLAGVVIM